MLYFMGDRVSDGHALVIGRFQPFHKGHLEVVRKCAAESDKLIIGIGSAQYSHSGGNPFTAGERYEMVAAALDEAGIKNYCIVPVEDLNRYSVWVSHVESMVPSFSTVYSNNPFTRRLFLEAGYEVRDSPLYSREKFSGTEVRKNMLEGGNWEDLVPPAVAEHIKKIDGVNRLKAVAGEY